jgi:hypothetical protein
VCQPNGTTECAFLYAPEFKATIGASMGVFDDRTGDGRPDVWVGAPFLASSTSGGMVELYATSQYGSSSYPSVFTYISPDGGDGLGLAVAAGRDVNGDGLEDAIAGAPLATIDRGRVVMFLGSSGSLSGPAWSFDGVADGDLLGTYVALADLNCDSVADVVVGVPGSDAGATNAGAVAIFYGGTLPLSSTPDEEILGQVPEEGLGVVASVGDVDGDGCEDLLVGSPSFDGVFEDEGRAQVFRGGPQGLVQEPVWTDFGRFPLARFGEAVAGAGDVDGDSFLDIAVGAPDYDEAGRVSVYRGLAPSGPRVSAGLPERVEAGTVFQPQLAGFSDPAQGQTLTCLWTWDDGELGTLLDPCKPVDVGGVTHVFRNPGVYRVRLRVVRADGVVGEAVTTVTVVE